jgi:hypothetical protein
MRTTFWTRWALPILSGSTSHVALPVALIVGTVLLAVNQGAQLLAGEVDPAIVVRALANFAIAYVVSSIGYLKAPDNPQQPRGEDVTH